MQKTIREVSVEHAISRFTIQRAIRDGVFPSVKVGNNYVIDTSSKEFKQWLHGYKPRDRKKAADSFIHGTFTLSGERKRRLAALVGSSEKEQLIGAAREHLYEWIDSLPL